MSHHDPMVSIRSKLVDALLVAGPQCMIPITALHDALLASDPQMTKTALMRTLQRGARLPKPGARYQTRFWRYAAGKSGLHASSGLNYITNPGFDDSAESTTITSEVLCARMHLQGMLKYEEEDLAEHLSKMRADFAAACRKHQDYCKEYYELCKDYKQKHNQPPDMFDEAAKKVTKAEPAPADYTYTRCI